MDVLKQFGTDEQKEVQGVWHPMGDGRVLVARSGNRKYAKAISKAYQQNQHLLQVETDEADKLGDDIVIDVMARTILLGWENLSLGGERLEYSVDNAKRLLSIKDFRKHIAKLSEDMEQYKAKEEQEAGES